MGKGSSEHIGRCETLVDVLSIRAGHCPDKDAFIYLADGEQEKACLSYGKLDEKARAIAVALQGAGASGKPVLILFPSGLDYICAYLGCLYCGAIAVPAYPPRPNKSLERIISIANDSGASLVLTNRKTLERTTNKMRELAPASKLKWIAIESVDDSIADQWKRPQINGDSLAFLQYTSGSTSEPKGVMVTHANLLHNERMMQAAFGQTEESIIAGWLPLYHDMGLIGMVLQPLYLGALCVLMSSTSFLQRPFVWLQAITSYKATTSGGPNFAYELCTTRISPEQVECLDLRTWTVAFNGSEPVREETLRRFARMFAPAGFRKDAFYPCYGLAESTLLVSARTRGTPTVVKRLRAKDLEKNLVTEATADNGREKSVVGCGRPVCDQTIRIFDLETSSECPPGVIGEICVSGPSVTQGYWNRAEETRQTFKNRFNGIKESFLRTGDLGFVADGELFITGRIKDLIIIRGQNHYPQDIEHTMESSHSGLRPGCGAAFSINLNGQEELALVQELHRKYRGDLREVISAIRRAVAEMHEVPVGHILLVEAGSVPKTSSGKIKRRGCKEVYLAKGLTCLEEWRADSANSLSVEQPDIPDSMEPVRVIELWLKTKIGEKLGCDPSTINTHDAILNYGLDSLMAADLTQAIGSKLHISIRIEDLIEEQSVASLTRLILERLEGGEKGEKKRIEPVSRQRHRVKVSGEGRSGEAAE